MEDEDEELGSCRCQQGRQRGDKRKFVLQMKLNRAKELALKGEYFYGLVQAPARGDGQQR